MSESPDSGTSTIASLFAGSIPGLAAPDGPGIEADATVGLHIALGNLVSEMTAERMRKERLALDVSYLSAPAVSSGVLPFATPQWGPASGWAWAVQRITVAGFAATTDFVIAFRGNNANSDSVSGNALFTFQEAVAGGTATWHPGRTGLVLRGEESLVFGGTFTGSAAAPLVVSCDVIQLSMAKLPYFLL